MPATSKTARHASHAAIVLIALTLPASIVFGRSALAVSLGLAVLSLTVAVAAGMRWPLWGTHARIPLALAGLIAVAWLPSVAVSLEPAASAVTLVRTLLLVAVGVALTSFLTQDGTHRAERTFIAGMVVAELFAFGALFVHSGLVGFRGTANANPHLMLKASASAIACALPVLVYAGWRLGGRWRYAGIACVLLGFAIMFGTGSKSSLAGFLVAIALAASVAATRLVRPWTLMMALTIPLGLAVTVFSSVSHLTPNITVGGYRPFAPAWVIDLHRQTIWQFTLERFHERPWFGWGLNVINKAPGAGEVIPELDAEFIPAHPHNWMIETLAESGVIGFLPLLTVVLGVACAAAWAYRHHGNPVWLAWMALWLTYWSAGAFNFSMWNMSWQASGMVLAVLACSHFRRKADA